MEQFRAIFAAELGWMWTTLRRLGVRPGDLEDVTHDVFLQVHAKLATYDPTRPLRPWLFAFAFRTASDYRRLARHREGDPEALEAMHDARPLPDEVAMQREDADLVQAALATLDLDRRAVLVGTELEGIPMAELAAMLGIPVNTAYSRLRLGRADFTAAVRRLAKTKEGAR